MQAVSRAVSDWWILFRRRRHADTVTHCKISFVRHAEHNGWLITPVCSIKLTSCYSNDCDLEPASTSGMDRSIVFARWRPYASASNTWFPGPTRVRPPPDGMGSAVDAGYTVVTNAHTQITLCAIPVATVRI